MKDLFVTTNTKSVKHLEGDVWTESGKTWTIKNGIKRTVSKMDEARKSVLTPLCCPNCNGSMKHYLDEKMWAIHKLCFNCTIDMEHEIMKAGKWEEYEKGKIKANAISYFKDVEAFLEEFSEDQISKSHVTEDGLIERWKDADSKYLKEVSDTIKTQLKETVEAIK